MGERIIVLKPYISVERDCCAICETKFDAIGRHAVELPVSMRDALVCDDCAAAYPIVCQCCGAGHSMNQIIEFLLSEG